MYHHRLVGEGGGGGVRRYLSGRSSGGVCFFGFFLPCEAFILTCVNALRLFLFFFSPLDFFFFFFPFICEGGEKRKEKNVLCTDTRGGRNIHISKKFFFFIFFLPFCDIIANLTLFFPQTGTARSGTDDLDLQLDLDFDPSSRPLRAQKKQIHLLPPVSRTRLYIY